jgi:RNase P/RNase MRP subunit p30
MHFLLFIASGLPEEGMIDTLKHYNLHHVIHTDAQNNLQCISRASLSQLALLAAYG